MISPVAYRRASFCRRRRAVKFWSAAARRGAAQAAKKSVFKDSRNIYVLSSKSSDDLSLFLFCFFLVIENCNEISTQQQWHRRRVEKLSAAARHLIKVGGGATRSERSGHYSGLAMSSQRNFGARPCWDLAIRSRTLYLTQAKNGSQCSSLITQSDICV